MGASTQGGGSRASHSRVTDQSECSQQCAVQRGEEMKEKRNGKRGARKNRKNKRKTVSCCVDSNLGHFPAAAVQTNKINSQCACGRGRWVTKAARALEQRAGSTDPRSPGWKTGTRCSTERCPRHAARHPAMDGSPCAPRFAWRAAHMGNDRAGTSGWSVLGLTAASSRRPNSVGLTGSAARTC